jgi:hypothetical protein
MLSARKKGPSRERSGPIFTDQSEAKTMTAAPQCRAVMPSARPVLLGLLGRIGEVVAAVGNVLTGACPGIATGECRGARNEKQSDESSHECSPLKNAFD